MNLTEKEKAVMDLVQKGHNNHAIGVRLNLSVNTVKFHLSNIYKKLQVANRLQATMKYNNH